MHGISSSSEVKGLLTKILCGLQLCDNAGLTLFISLRDHNFTLDDDKELVAIISLLDNDLCERGKEENKKERLIFKYIYIQCKKY